MQEKIFISQAEKANYDYIYLDSAGNVHVMVPVVGAGDPSFVVGGGDIGGDNTCQIATALKKFFGIGFGFSGNPAAVRSINLYIRDLDFDLAHVISPNAVEKKAKENRKKQLQEYLSIFKRINNNELSDALAPPAQENGSHPFPFLPQPIQKAIKKVDSNCVGIRLCPDAPDLQLRITDPIFGFSRHHIDGKNSPLCTAIKSACSNTQPPSGIEAKLRKDILAEFNSKNIHNDEDVTKLVNLAVKKLKEFNEKNQLKIDSEQFQLREYNFKQIRNIVDLNDDEQLSSKDALLILAEQCLGLIKVFYDKKYPDFESSPFFGAIEQKAEYNPSGEAITKLSHDRLSIMAQFYLAIAFVDYREHHRNDAKNYGTEVEKFSNEIAEAIRNSLEKSESVEDAILSVLTEKLEKGALKKHFSDGEARLRINQRFRENYTQIKDSPHFDEFLLLMRDPKEGYFYNYQAYICLPLWRYEEFFSSLGGIGAGITALFSSSAIKREIATNEKTGVFLGLDNRERLFKTIQTEIDLQAWLNDFSKTDSTIAQLLMATSLDEKPLYEVLTEEQRIFLSKHARWPAVKQILFSQLPKVAQEKFTKSWYPESLHLTRDLQDQLIAVYCKEGRSFSDLNDLTQAKRMEKVLQNLFAVEASPSSSAASSSTSTSSFRFEITTTSKRDCVASSSAASVASATKLPDVQAINNANWQSDDEGGWLIALTKTQHAKLNQLLKTQTDKIHVTPEMASAVYAAVSEDKLKGYENNGQKAHEQSKIIVALRQAYPYAQFKPYDEDTFKNQKTDSNIVYVNYFGGNGFEIFSQSTDKLKEVKEYLQDLDYGQSLYTLTSDETAYLFEQAKINYTQEIRQETIEEVCRRLNIYHQGGIQILENGSVRLPLPLYAVKSLLTHLIKYKKSVLEEAKNNYKNTYEKIGKIVALYNKKITVIIDSANTETGQKAIENDAPLLENLSYLQQTLKQLSINAPAQDVSLDKIEQDLNNPNLKSHYDIKKVIEPLSEVNKQPAVYSVSASALYECPLHGISVYQKINASILALNQKLPSVSHLNQGHLTKLLAYQVDWLIDIVNANKSSFRFLRISKHRLTAESLQQALDYLGIEYIGEITAQADGFSLSFSESALKEVMQVMYKTYIEGSFSISTIHSLEQILSDYKHLKGRDIATEKKDIDEAVGLLQLRIEQENDATEKQKLETLLKNALNRQEKIRALYLAENKISPKLNSNRNSLEPSELELDCQKFLKDFKRFAFTDKELQPEELKQLTESFQKLAEYSHAIATINKNLPDLTKHQDHFEKCLRDCAGGCIILSKDQCLFLLNGNNIDMPTFGSEEKKAQELQKLISKDAKVQRVTDSDKVPMGDGLTMDRAVDRYQIYGKDIKGITVSLLEQYHKIYKEKLDQYTFVANLDAFQQLSDALKNDASSFTAHDNEKLNTLKKFLTVNWPEKFKNAQASVKTLEATIKTMKDSTFDLKKCQDALENANLTLVNQLENGLAGDDFIKSILPHRSIWACPAWNTPSYLAKDCQINQISDSIFYFLQEMEAKAAYIRLHAISTNNLLNEKGNTSSWWYTKQKATLDTLDCWQFQVKGVAAEKKYEKALEAITETLLQSLPPQNQNVVQVKNTLLHMLKVLRPKEGYMSSEMRLYFANELCNNRWRSEAENKKDIQRAIDVAKKAMNEKLFWEERIKSVFERSSQSEAKLTLLLKQIDFAHQMMNYLAQENLSPVDANRIKTAAVGLLIGLAAGSTVTALAFLTPFLASALLAAAVIGSGVILTGAATLTAHLVDGKIQTDRVDKLVEAIKMAPGVLGKFTFSGNDSLPKNSSV